MAVFLFIKIFINDNFCYNKIMKKIILIFILAFILNLIWENFHALLYVNYQGEKITQLILLRASLFDALFITLLSLPFIFIKYFNQRIWYSIVIGIIFAIILERWALATGRWAYNDLMPIIPIIKTGLTPTLQLGLLSFLIFKFSKIDKK